MNLDKNYPADPFHGRSLLGALVALGDHEQLLSAAAMVDLEEDLAVESPLIVIAPSDAAFGRLVKGTISRLAAGDAEPLLDLLEFHMIRGVLDLNNLEGQCTCESVHGALVEIEKDDDGLFVAGREVLTVIQCSNGLLLLVDEVLGPPGTEAARIVSSRSRGATRPRSPFRRTAFLPLGEALGAG